jgi:uncharacterized protein (TIGR00661 family)
MGTLFYGMSGEGRGHATRARAVVEALRHQHRIVIFAPDLAYELLAPLYAGSEVRVVPIPGARFVYGRRGRVALLGTVAAAARFRLALAGHVRAVLPEFEREKPDLVIADFEPILPRAARQLGIPFVSFDHQHYLVVNDLSALPRWIRAQAALAAPFVRALYDWQAGTIVSSFYAPPLKTGFADVVQVGVLIRPELLRVRPERGRHLVVYLRRFAPPHLMSALERCGREVRVYGLGTRPAQGRMRFLAINERHFIEDLATCDAVVSTAGNQLVGEALHVRKPVLALPEPRNFEQSVNGHFLEHSGAGWTERGCLTSDRLARFLEHTDQLRACIVPERVCGNEAAVAALARHLRPAALPGWPQPAPVRAGGEQWA